MLILNYLTMGYLFLGSIALDPLKDPFKEPIQELFREAPKQSIKEPKTGLEFVFADGRVKQGIIYIYIYIYMGGCEN